MYNNENNHTQNYDSSYDNTRQQPRPPFVGPYQPPFGAPFQPPFDRPPQPPYGPPVGIPPGQQPPSTPPPRFIPQQQPTIFAIDPGAIRPCLFRFVYLWLEDGRQFWAYLIFAGRRSVAGYRWTGFRWVYFGTDLRNISSFVCY